MFINTKAILAAALVAGTSTIALASEFDPNLANRYPAYADPIGGAQVSGTFQSAPVQLHSGRNVGVISQFYGYTNQADPFEVLRRDRASWPYAGGGF